MIPLMSTALILGLAGSIHCVGMCGPLVLSLPGQESWQKQILNNSVYQVGRVLTYVILGIVLGFIGQSFSFAGLQQPLSISIGILLLVFLFLPRKFKLKLESKVGNTAFSKKVKKAWAYFFNKQSVPAFFAIGMLNGLLPCGLVYTALAGALAGGSPLNSGLFMLFFGIGTSPALLTAGSLKTVFHKKLLQWKHIILPVSIGTMALLFILRGASLDIPYLSPQIEGDSVKPCCEHAAN